MQYNFKVDINKVYRYFVDEIDEEYIQELKDKYDEFKIKYNDSPSSDSVLDFLNEIEGLSDHYQILLVGINEDIEEVLCYYFVGEDYDDEDKERMEALEDFKRIKECKIE